MSDEVTAALVLVILYCRMTGFGTIATWTMRDGWRWGADRGCRHRSSGAILRS